MPTRQRVGAPRLLRQLSALSDYEVGEARTAYLPDRHRRSSLPPALQDAVTEAGTSATGYVVLCASSLSVSIVPPFPIAVERVSDGLAVNELIESLTARRTLGVVLLRLGGYSVGLLRDGAFARTRTGGRFIKNRHRKGGQSQRRFDRIRDGHIRQQFDDLHQAVRDLLVPEVGSLDGVVLGGDRHTLQGWLARAPLPASLAAKVLPRWIDTQEPRRDVLVRSPYAIWSSDVTILRDDTGIFSGAADILTDRVP